MLGWRALVVDVLRSVVITARSRQHRIDSSEPYPEADH